MMDSTAEYTWNELTNRIPVCLHLDGSPVDPVTVEVTGNGVTYAYPTGIRAIGRRTVKSHTVDWKNVVIHNMRTEGAFLISAARLEGKIRWVRIKSLAGEPCYIFPGLQDDMKAAGSDISIKALGNGLYELGLKKGEEVLLYSGETVPIACLEPVAADLSLCNFWGGRKT